jgi:hypothetical protein
MVKDLKRFLEMSDLWGNEEAQQQQQQQQYNSNITTAVVISVTHVSTFMRRS